MAQEAACWACSWLVRSRISGAASSPSVYRSPRWAASRLRCSVACFSFSASSAWARLLTYSPNTPARARSLARSSRERFCASVRNAVAGSLASRTLPNQSGAFGAVAVAASEVDEASDADSGGGSAGADGSGGAEAGGLEARARLESGGWVSSSSRSGCTPRLLIVMAVCLWAWACRPRAWRWRTEDRKRIADLGEAVVRRQAVLFLHALQHQVLGVRARAEEFDAVELVGRRDGIKHRLGALGIDRAGPAADVVDQSLHVAHAAEVGLTHGHTRRLEAGHALAAE